MSMKRLPDGTICFQSYCNQSVAKKHCIVIRKFETPNDTAFTAIYMLAISLAKRSTSISPHLQACCNGTRSLTGVYDLHLRWLTRSWRSRTNPLDKKRSKCRDYNCVYLSIRHRSCGRRPLGLHAASVPRNRIRLHQYFITARFVRFRRINIRPIDDVGLLFVDRYVATR